MRVIDGGLTFSLPASSPMVIGPPRSSVPRVASWLRLRPSPRSKRSRRARRITLDAQRAGEGGIGVDDGHIVSVATLALRSQV